MGLQPIPAGRGGGKPGNERPELVCGPAGAERGIPETVRGIPETGIVSGRHVFYPFADYFKKAGYKTLYVQTGGSV